MIDIPITTERLIIRQFEAKDLEPFLSFMLDEESTRYMTFEAEQKTQPGATAMLAYVLQSYDSPEPVHAYVIADKKTGDYLGSCGYSPYEEGVVEFYYAVNAEHRGKGITTEAAKALIHALADAAGVKELRAYCHPENSAAHDVASKSGMTANGLAKHKDLDTPGKLFVQIAN